MTLLASVRLDCDQSLSLNRVDHCNEVNEPPFTMSKPTIPQFLSSLEQSQLLTDAQFQRLKKQLADNSLTADGLASVLVGQKHLTQWQAKQLLKGQSGLVLQHYQLLNPVGRGGMGHVFEAAIPKRATSLL